MYPEIIDVTDVESIYLDGIYISSIMIIGYPKQLNFLQYEMFGEMKYINIIDIKKQDANKILKELTYNLSSSKSNLKNNSINRIDYDNVTKYNNDMLNLRKDIQINLESIYKVYNIISISSTSKEELKKHINILREKLYSKNFKTIKLNFRHLQGYLSTVISENLNSNLESYNKILTSSNLISTFPFLTKNIIDTNGILLGLTNFNEVILVDMFDEKYLNSNMCIFGSSGTGKSFFTKLLIFRNYINDINGYIFDLEGEYIDIARKCNGEIININDNDTYINILEITKFDLKNNFLDNKCKEIINILKTLENNSKNKDFIIENSEMLYEILNKTYNLYGINNDKNSIYSLNKEYIEKKIKNNKEFPVLKDVIKCLDNEEINAKYSKKIINESKKILNAIITNYKIFNGHSTINIYNDLLCFNFKGIDKKSMYSISKIIFTLIDKKIDFDNNKSLIYIDEVWKYISEDKELANIIVEKFKTIRKRKAGMVVITQDIGDVFCDNQLGKIIINNSNFIVFFKMEHADKEELVKSGMDYDNIWKAINILSKGNCILKVNSNIVKMKIVISKNERQILMEENSHDNSSDR